MHSSAAGDTIVALSSGKLPAGIAVVRISGPRSRFVLETISRGASPPPGQSKLRKLFLTNGKLLDRGLILFFKAPRSFTGEDCVELHVHGGKAVVASLLKEVTAIEGVRLAEAGEFTLRAFLNGKLDLTQAEALGDLISSETEAQRRFAVHNSGGVQSALYQDWRRRLIEARAMIEAEMDFSDEADVLASGTGPIWNVVRELCRSIRSHIKGYRTAEIIRDGYDVVIVGAPNAGKSSLLNALARRDAAIVSDEPGTTRDLVEVALDLDGCKVRLTDTAGLREDAGRVERIGIERAKARAREADLVLHLFDARTQPAPHHLFAGVEAIWVGAKADLLPPGERRDDVLISSLTGQGIEDLLELLSRRAADAANPAGDILPSQLRHVELLEMALLSLEKTQASGLAPELQAEHLRLAAESLGRISGAVDVEDLLDVIFSRFCIGK